MYQHTRLSASWSCCNYDIFRLFVIDYLALPIGEFTKKFVVFGWCDVLVYLRTSFFLEVHVNELAEVQGEVVVDKTQRSIVVAHHQVGIFSYNVNLSNALFIEFIQQAILLFAISCTAIYEAANLHSVVDDNESSFNLHQFNLRKV